MYIYIHTCIHIEMYIIVNLLGADDVHFYTNIYTYINYIYIHIYTYIEMCMIISWGLMMIPKEQVICIHMHFYINMHFYIYIYTYIYIYIYIYI